LRISGLYLFSTDSPRSTASPGATARFAQVLTGAEAASGAGQHQHPRLVELAERVGDLLVHLHGEAVEPVGRLSMRRAMPASSLNSMVS
jgi:hypothetical protein